MPYEFVLTDVDGPVGIVTIHRPQVRNALNQQGSYQNHHRVYDRAGAPCTRCRTGQIVRMVQAQRATFFCPGCQRPRRG